jgi:hypothetical protein
MRVLASSGASSCTIVAMKTTAQLRLQEGSRSADCSSFTLVATRLVSLGLFRLLVPCVVVRGVSKSCVSSGILVLATEARWPWRRCSVFLVADHDLWTSGALESAMREFRR